MSADIEASVCNAQWVMEQLCLLADLDESIRLCGVQAVQGLLAIRLLVRPVGLGVAARGAIVAAWACVHPEFAAVRTVSSHR